MTRRTLAVLWLAVGIALWNGVFDLYISRGAREYLQLRAEFELGRGPEPSMDVVMARAKRMGFTAATLWATGVTACGWVTIAMLSRTRAHPPANRPAS